MIEKIYIGHTHGGSNDLAIAAKINEIIDFLNNLSLTAPPKRHFKSDYGWIYEVDEFGNLVIPPGGPR
jgi:hypothetical protein